MGYSVSAIDPATDDVREFDEPHFLFGSHIEIGGSTTAKMLITYNYHDYYVGVWGHSLSEFNGKQVSEVLEALELGVEKLGVDKSGNYWESTPGNAGAAIRDLSAILRMCEPTDVVEVS